MFLRARDALLPAFGGSAVFLFDNHDLFLGCKEEYSGCFLLDKNYSSSDLQEEAAGVIFCVTERDVPELSALRGLLAKRTVLHLPTYAFDGSVVATKYTAAMCAMLDLADCVRRNRLVLDEYASARDTFSLHGNCSSISFQLTPEILIMQAATEVAMPSGEDFALSNYTEVALIPNSFLSGQASIDELGYDIKGSFDCHCALVAIHRGADLTVVQGHKTLRSVFGRLFDDGEYPLRVRIARFQVIEILTRSGFDMMSLVQRWMHSDLENSVTEVGIGTNSRTIFEQFDWRINSPFNETALGFHIGLGDGIRCPHIDLVCCASDSYDAFFD